MTNKWRFIGKLSIVLLLTGIFSLSSTHSILAAGSPDSPLLLGLDRENSLGGFLMGGFSKNGWWGMNAFPLSVNGKPFANDGTCAENLNDTAKDLAETPLLTKGMRLNFYALDGAVVGTGVTNGAVRYECYEANGQTLLSPELEDMKLKEAGGSDDFPFVIGLREGVPVNFAQTKRTEEKDKRVSFSAESAGKPIRIVYTRTGNGDHTGEYSAELIVDGKSRPFAPAFAGETGEISGYFIDFYADGALEFLSVTEGPAAGVSLYSLAASDPEKALMTLDLGE